MAIDKSGQWWTGTKEDLNQYLDEYGASNGHQSVSAVQAACTNCGHDEFGVRVDDEEGCAERTCRNCASVTLMFDSADTVDEADLGQAQCPCDGETFNVAGGLAIRDDGEVHWVFVGLRCTNDGVLGCYVDWKIDYAPTAHLASLV